MLGSALFSCEIIHHYINTFLKFIPGLYLHMAFTQPWNSAGNAKRRCLIDEFWTACVSLPLFPVSTSAITAVHRKISCCVWKSDWQQAANSQTAAEVWFTEINKHCLCCCNVLCSTLSESDCFTDWLADRLPDWMTIWLSFLIFLDLFFLSCFLPSFLWATFRLIAPCKPYQAVYPANTVK